MPRFILLDTSHPGNVGAAARAIKVMGFSELVLVRPRFADVLSREETVAMASGAADVLTRARIVPHLSDALEGVDTLCATAMTPRDFGPPTVAPRAYFERLFGPSSNAAPFAPVNDVMAEVSAPPRLALLFGGERFGLSNEDVWRCHVCLSIPTAPGYGSLNLSQAVQLIAYELRMALGGFEVVPRTDAPQAADAASVQGVLDHWQQVLQDIGFLDPAAPKKLMPRLNQLLNRAQLTPEEVHILRGVARAVVSRRKP